MANELTPLQYDQDVQATSQGKTTNRLSTTLARWLGALSRNVIDLVGAITISSDSISTTKPTYLNNGFAIPLAYTTDLDTVINTGFYDGADLLNAPVLGWFDGADPLNAPVLGWLYVEVIRHANENSTDWVMQRVTTFGAGNTANLSWQRVKVNGIWQPWKVLLA